MTDQDRALRDRIQARIQVLATQRHRADRSTQRVLDTEIGRLYRQISFLDYDAQPPAQRRQDWGDDWALGGNGQPAACRRRAAGLHRLGGESVRRG